MFEPSGEVKLNHFSSPWKVPFNFWRCPGEGLLSLMKQAHSKSSQRGSSVLVSGATVFKDTCLVVILAILSSFITSAQTFSRSSFQGRLFSAVQFLYRCAVGKKTLVWNTSRWTHSHLRFIWDYGRNRTRSHDEFPRLTYWRSARKPLLLCTSHTLLAESC